MHRLIHPWTANADAGTANRAHHALRLWRSLLAEIDCDGFDPTGVLAVPSDGAGRFEAPAIRHERLTEAEIPELCSFLSGSGTEAIFFPDYGVLYAERILHALAAHLAKRGVEMHPGRAVAAVDAPTGQVVFHDNVRAGFDHVVLAAGTGSGAILSRSTGLTGTVPRFAARRCHVAYLDLSGAPEMARTRVAWAALGHGDYWGMPPLGHLPMKLGCGDFTRPGDTKAPGDATLSGRSILEQYRRRFPAFARARLLRGAYNHWTAIDAKGPACRQDRLTVVTSDNGAGFKLAPLAAREALAAYTEDRPR
jgi:glycine/D-amino acid oxidase-like deaminating enzyme